MSSNRHSRRFVCIGLLGLAGCGFAPIYGDGAAPRGAYQSTADASVMGYRLAGRLANRLGDPAAVQFGITAKLDVSQRAAAITSDGDTSRFNVIGSAEWTLTDIATDGEIATGTVDAFTSYSATGSTAATQTAQDDARARLAVMLADMIVTRVLIATPDASP